MSKLSYKIPDSLDKNFLDTELSLKSEGGIGLKPMPVAIIMMYVGSIILWFFVTTKSFIVSGGLITIVPFTILWALLTFTLLKRDNTGSIAATYILSMINYLPKHLRRLYTRRTNKATAFHSLVGIEDINKKTGLITMSDGYAYMYSVVGSASILLFDADKDAITDRCDTFYRKIKSDSELHFITTKEPQSVYTQLSAYQDRYASLEFEDEDVRALIDMNFRYLRDEVGSNFRSIHQYLLLKAENKEALTVAHNIVISEAENSSLIFKKLQRIGYYDIVKVLSTIYK